MSALLRGLLLLDGVQDAHQVAHDRIDRTGDALHGRLDGAQDAGDDLGTRRKLGDLVELRAIIDLMLDDADLEFQLLVLLAELLDDPRLSLQAQSALSAASQHLSWH